MVDDEVRQKLLDEHLSLGREKCLSYLPLRTISEILNMTPEAYAAEARNSNLQTIAIEAEQTCISGGAVYVYSDVHLSALLSRHRAHLGASDWPTDCEEFVRRIAREWLADGHPVKHIIRRAFGDPVPDRKGERD